MTFYQYNDVCDYSLEVDKKIEVQNDDGEYVFIELTDIKVK